MLRNIVIFTFGYISGGFSLLVIISLMFAAKRGDREMSKQNKQSSDPYKCPQNPIKDCNKRCCKFCFESKQCDWACDSDPSLCSNSQKIN